MPHRTRRTRSPLRRLSRLVLSAYCLSLALAAAPRSAVAQVPPPPPHAVPVSAAPGSPYPWEGSVAGVNTANGNKLTVVPLVGWTALGGMPVQFSLHHNSQGAHNGELGRKWTHSYDIYLVVEGYTDDTVTATVHWGDDLAYRFLPDFAGGYTPPTGIHDTLVANGSPVSSWDLTTKGQVTYRFTNPNGTGWHCASITDRSGNAITLNRNAGNYVTSIVDPTNRTLTLGYDGSNRITSVTDPLSRVWAISYNGSNQLTQVEWPAVGGNAYTQEFAYNASHCIATFTDRRGKEWDFTYNADNSLASATDPCGNTSTFGYTSSQVTVTDANSHTLKHNYSSGRLSSVVDALNNTESYTYDAAKNRTGITDRRGKSWSYTFDSRGNVLTATDPLNHTTTWTWTALNDPLTQTDGLDHEVEWGYDASGNLTSYTDGLGHTTTYTVNGSGLCTAAQDALTHSVTFGYDTHGNWDSFTDGLDNESTATFNALGVCTSQTDAGGHTTSYTLDGWCRVTNATRSSVTIGSRTYGAESHVLTATDANNHTVSRTYDDNGRLASRTNGRSDVVTYTWDATGKKGLLSSKTNGRSYSTTYSYTSRNQLSGASYPGSTAESWTYNANGQVSGRTNGRGQSIAYAYDDAGRLTGIDYPSGTDTAFSYDAADRCTGMTDATGTTTWSYDAADRLTGIASPAGTLGYGYDNADRCTSVALTGVGTWEYAYDAADQPTDTTDPWDQTSTTAYNDEGLVTQVTHTNTSVTLYDYDAFDRCIDVWHKTSGGATLGRNQYEYDNAGNVTERTDSDGSVTTFGYDAADQLTGESRTGSGAYTLTYSYDANSNRLTRVLNNVTENYSYDANDKLQSAGGKSYAYDQSGNCTSVTLNNQTTTLSWDFEDRLVGITYPNQSTNSFAYNGLGLRVGKTDSGGSRSYVTGGSEVASPVLSDGSAVYTPGEGERRSGATKTYHTDALGSVRGITSAAQSATDATLYDAFGVVVSRTGSTPTPFGFAGDWQYQGDPDSGLMLLGHRYYDPSTGRFLSQDPIGDGDNWYAYCGNNPLTGVDPEGLAELVRVGPWYWPEHYYIRWPGGSLGFWPGDGRWDGGWYPGPGQFQFPDPYRGRGTVIDRIPDPVTDDQLRRLGPRLGDRGTRWWPPYSFAYGPNCLPMALIIWDRLSGDHSERTRGGNRDRPPGNPGGSHVPRRLGDGSFPCE